MSGGAELSDHGVALDTKYGYVELSDAHDRKYGKPFPVPIVMATEENLKGYGTIVNNFDETKVEITPLPVKARRLLFPGTGDKDWECSGEFLYKWTGEYCTALNKAVHGDYVTGRLPRNVSPSNRTHVLVREAKYHPDGGQVFFPLKKTPFVALLALPGKHIKLEDFVAFYFDGNFGFQIHADIWHQPLYPISDEAVFLGKQGAVHACVLVDTVKEFGKYLLVPLNPPEK